MSWNNAIPGWLWFEVQEDIKAGRTCVLCWAAIDPPGEPNTLCEKCEVTE